MQVQTCAGLIYFSVLDQHICATGSLKCMYFMWMNLDFNVVTSINITASAGLYL